MPLHEFVCPNCGKKVESLRKKVICECGEEMKKLFPIPAFRVYTKVR